MATSLALNSDWDLFADPSGNIATVKGAAQIAQDVASSVRTFRGDLWYDTTQGIQYDLILGQRAPLSLIRSAFINAALTVPDTVSAVCYLAVGAGRQLIGQVQVKDNLGNLVVATSA